MTSTSAPMYHAREIKAYADIKTYIQMLMETLLTITRNWKQCNGSSAGEHPHNKILLSNNKEQTTGTCNHIDESQHSAQRKVPEAVSSKAELELAALSLDVQSMPLPK